MTLHGGNIHKASKKTGLPLKKIIDFSASINPLGVPASAAAAIKNGIGLLPHYPEPAAESLASVIAGHYGISSRSVICGNGSTELIYLIPRVLRPKRVLITSPTFSEYEKACTNSNDKLQVASYKLRRENNFDIDPDDYIKAIQGDLNSSLVTRHSSQPFDLAFLCNPNNPTGRLLKKEDVLKIADAARRLGCYLVVDEAFMDFCPDESVLNNVRRNPYLIVLRSLTKFYALAGLRIGFGVFPPDIAEQMKMQKEPWTVNCLADAAARAVLDDSEYRDRSLEYISRERHYIEKGLKSLSLEIIPSSVNYYLVRMRAAGHILNNLSKKGILLRDCSNFVGLGDGYVRIAVRSRRENTILLRELAGLCQA